VASVSAEDFDIVLMDVHSQPALVQEARIRAFP
jgi:hypothetical protein